MTRDAWSRVFWLAVRVVFVCGAAMLASLVVGMTVGMFWLLTLYEEVPGGSGNARHGHAWFGVGAAVGGLAGAAVAAWLGSRFLGPTAGGTRSATR